MTETNGLSPDQYGVLVSGPGGQLRMRELGARRPVTRSKITRVIDDLERYRLVKCTRDPADGRSFLGADQVERLAEIWDTAVLGVVRAEVWPPAELRSRA
jgi:hypothetical protein